MQDEYWGLLRMFLISLLILISTVVEGAEQRDVEMISDWLVAKKNVEGSLDTAADRFKISLSPEAKDLIVKDFILRRISEDRPGGTKIVFLPKESQQLVSLIAEKSKGQKVGANIAESVLVDWKTNQLEPTFSTQISRNAELAGIILVGRTGQLLESDLLLNTK